MEFATVVKSRSRLPKLEKNSSFRPREQIVLSSISRTEPTVISKLFGSILSLSTNPVGFVLPSTLAAPHTDA